MQHTLIIRHIDKEPDKFQVTRLKDGKSAPSTAEIPSPDRFPVEGRPDSNLSMDLRWYLDRFLDYPFHPDTDVAERVQDSLRRWGVEAFNGLFDNRASGRLFDASTNEGYRMLHLQIFSEDPRVLSWPWEAMRDPEANYLSHTCQIERRLDKVRDPLPLSPDLPRERVNILLITARPYENDVQYRSISRLLVELIEERDLPARVHVLRPPTFDNLRDHLRANPNFYHILHFDGHGAYSENRPDPESGFTFRGREGRLIFENEKGEPKEVHAELLSSLLREHAIPTIVLNACQSGTIDHRAQDVFASVASALIQSGVRSVVAMAYSLYVSGAQTFLSAFYRRLFEIGSVARAARAGRQ